MPRQIGWKTNREGVRMTECQGCGARANENRIDPVIKDVWSRVEAGEVMPAGECHKCGSVAHLLPLYDKEAARDEELGQLGELADFLEEAHEDEIRNRHHGDAGGSRTCSYCQAIKKARRLVERANPSQEAQ